MQCITCSCSLLACSVPNLLVGEEESCHRVLFLAPKRCMGRVEGCFGGKALDPRTVRDRSSSLCLTQLFALVMLCCCVGCIVPVAGFGDQEVSCCRHGLGWCVYTQTLCCSCSCRDKIILLNKTTEIINFWQDSEVKKTVAEAKEAFPDCTFQGSD